MESSPAYQPEPMEEIIGGNVIMRPSPSLYHIFVAANLYKIFDRFLEGKPCTVIPDGAGLYLEGKTEKFRPDMMVVCDPDKLRGQGVYGPPDLVAEVLSPSTRRADRGYKFRLYEKHGVREYWLVNPMDHSVEQYLLEDGRFTLRDVYQEYSDVMRKTMTEEEAEAMVAEFPCGIFPDLLIRLEDVFRMVRPLR